MEGQNFAIDARFANAPRDQLSVLRAKVEYDYSFVSIGWKKKKTSEID